MHTKAVQLYARLARERVRPQLYLAAFLGLMADTSIPGVTAASDMSEALLGRNRDNVWVSHVEFGSTSAALKPSSSAASIVIPSASDEMMAPPPPPAAICVRCSVYGRLVFDALPKDTTICDIKRGIAERLLLPPGRQIHLSVWGRDLLDHLTLQESHLKTNSIIDMRTLHGIPAAATTLSRVRIASPGLETQTFPVTRATTGLELKRGIEAHLSNGEHEWFSKNGSHLAVCGTTVLATSKVGADEKAGTAAMRPGEHLITSTPLTGELGKGKPLSVVRARQGVPVMVNDACVAPLLLPPEKQRLQFMGRDITDDACLWDLGVRHEYAITLEFVSPVVPSLLSILRAPEKTKADKKKGGKGGKKGK